MIDKGFRPENQVQVVQDIQGYADFMNWNVITLNAIIHVLQFIHVGPVTPLVACLTAKRIVVFDAV